MKSGDLVYLHEEAILDIGLDQNVNTVGVLLDQEIWPMDYDNVIHEAKMWKVLVNNQIFILNEFSLTLINLHRKYEKSDN